MKTRQNQTSPLFLPGFCLATVIFIYPVISKADPTISWTPQTLSETVGQGQTKTEVISFTSSSDLEKITTLIVPDLQPYLKVTPSTFFSVRAEIPITITFTFSASDNAPLQTFNGTLHLQANASQTAIAKPISINLTICRCIVTKGFSLNYPSSLEWQLDSSALNLGGPISFNNFGNAYLQGGIIPRGGAAIDITTILLPSTPLPDFIKKETVDSTIESNTNMSVGGEPATKVVFTDSYAPSLTTKTIAVYVPYQALLYKFYISYRNGDSLETKFITAFQQVLESVKFTP